MSDLLNQTPAARDWVDNAIQRHSAGVFGTLLPSVIWSDARDDDGELRVPIDPVALVTQINGAPYTLFHNHDPGQPKGQIVEAATFETEDGKKFVAAILGYYAGGDVLDFRGLGLDTKALGAPPTSLPELPNNCWIQFAADPREVDAAWLDQVISDAPLRIERTELSHNAADSAHELIRIGLVYLAIVFSPFFTSIATEAGKDTYAAIHAWVRKLIQRLADRRDPILAIHAHQDGCQVSFILRGKDLKPHYAAHDALPGAAAQAAQLIAKLKALRMPARELVYEFDKEVSIWHPSYAVLNDNRIITDNKTLIAIEQLPKGLSLGLSRGQFLSPVIRSSLEDGDE